MMMESAARTEVGDPAPGARGRSYLLAFGVLASPAAWALALYALYGIGSHNCFPGASPRATGLWNASWLLWLIALVALAICIAAGAVSYWSWQEAYGENPGLDAMIQFGQGRARFMAVWGAMTSLLFGIVMLISLIPLFVVPICGS